MKSRIQKHLEKILIVVAFTAVLVGCSSTPERVDELEQARSLVQQVEASPDAGRLAADDIVAAHEALRRADRLAEGKGSVGEIQNEAYLARRHAEIAQQHIERGRAAAAMQEAEAERQRVLLQAREQQAAAEAQRAQLARQQAEQEAQQARLEAERLQTELRDLQARQSDRGLVVTLGDVLFDTGRATLRAGAMSGIQRLAEFLVKTPGRTVTIEGHTDSVGSEALNQTLSENRASAVRNELMSRGVSAARITTVGLGETRPVATNDTPAGRQQNRRVEVIVSNPPEMTPTGSSSTP